MIAQILLLKNAFFQAHPGMQKKKKKNFLDILSPFHLCSFSSKNDFFLTQKQIHMLLLYHIPCLYTTKHIKQERHCRCPLNAKFSGQFAHVLQAILRRIKLLCHKIIGKSSEVSLNKISLIL